MFGIPTIALRTTGIDAFGRLIIAVANARNCSSVSPVVGRLCSALTDTHLDDPPLGGTCSGGLCAARAVIDGGGARVHCRCSSPNQFGRAVRGHKWKMITIP